MAIAKPARTSVHSTPAGRSLPRPTLQTAWASFGLSREGLVAPMTRRWAVAPIAVAALLVTAAFVQPALAEEATGGQAVFESAIANLFFFGIVASVVGVMSLKRWGLATSFGLALLTAGLLVSCPASGHHTWGAWLIGQSALVLAATGLAGAALWKTNHR